MEAGFDWDNEDAAMESQLLASAKLYTHKAQGGPPSGTLGRLPQGAPNRVSQLFRTGPAPLERDFPKNVCNGPQSPPWD